MADPIMSIEQALAVADELSPSPARAVAALRTLRAVIEREQRAATNPQYGDEVYQISAEDDLWYDTDMDSYAGFTAGDKRTLYTAPQTPAVEDSAMLKWLLEPNNLHVVSALMMADQYATPRRACEALMPYDAAPQRMAQGDAAESVDAMTPKRAIFFLERFKREEKLLGPHEQRALELAVAALATQPPHQDRGEEAWRIASIVREALDRQTCPDHFMRIAVETVVAALTERPRPTDDELWDQTIRERDEAEEALGDMFQAVTGRPAEWSSAWHYADALEEVEASIAALTEAKQQGAQDGSAVDLLIAGGFVSPEKAAQARAIIAGCSPQVEANRLTGEVAEATDADIQEWLERHDLEHAIRGTDARAAFEDAQTFAAAAKPSGEVES